MHEAFYTDIYSHAAWTDCVSEFIFKKKKKKL